MTANFKARKKVGIFQIICGFDEEEQQRTSNDTDQTLEEAAAKKWRGVSTEIGP